MALARTNHASVAHTSEDCVGKHLTSLCCCEWHNNRWMIKAILSDSHFWIPVVVLAIGVSLLLFLR